MLCGIPGKDLPSVGWLEMLSFDKFVHASMFFALYFLSQRALYIENKQASIVLLLLCMAYGGLLEILQGLVFIDRSADIYDFIANGFGSYLAYLLRKKLIAKRN